jgi:hypothetical protein
MTLPIGKIELAHSQWTWLPPSIRELDWWEQNNEIKRLESIIARASAVNCDARVREILEEGMLPK